MELLTSVLAYIMASWPPLSQKNLINKTHGILLIIPLYYFQLSSAVFIWLNAWLCG